MNVEDFIVPHAQGVEKSILSVIMKKDALAQARAAGITEEHFHLPGNRALYRNLLERDAAGLSLELVGLVQHLSEEGELDDIGGPAAIYEIYTYAPNGAHWEEHVTVLRQQLAKRRAQSAALAILENGEGMDAPEIADALRAATEATAGALLHDTGVLTAHDAVTLLLEEMHRCSQNGEYPGIRTGLEPIDTATGGMREGELWVVAGESSQGKSVVMLQAVATALKAGKRCLVISLEMQAHVVISRIAANMRSIPLDTFTRPKKASAPHLTMAKDQLQLISAMPLGIHERGGCTFDDIRGIIEAEALRHGRIDLIAVDYLQLIEGSGRRKNESREQEVTGASRGMKAIAKKLKCSVFTASQLTDAGKMRDSRAIGHDADVLLVIEETGIRGLKVRNGERNQLFPLTLNGANQRFERDPTQPDIFQPYQ